MGGNNSRHGNGGEVLPVGIRQRIEEWRKRRSGTTLQREEGTSSNKNLLDDGKSQSSEEKENGNNNKGSPNDTQQAKQGVDEKKDQFVELKTEKLKSIKIKHEEVNAKDGSSDDDDEEEDDDIEDGRLIGPGSPSFKVYCKETKSKNEESSKVYCNETKNKNEESFKIYYNETKTKNEEELHESKALGTILSLMLSITLSFQTPATNEIYEILLDFVFINKFHH